MAKNASPALQQQLEKALASVGCDAAFLALRTIISDPDLSFDETVTALKAVIEEAKRLLTIAGA